MENEREIDCKNVCAGKIDIPTETEIEALNEMRNIKSRVKAVKEQIRQLAGSENEEARDRISELEKDLKRYRNQWLAWQERHRQAVRERMIILGHEE